jgi:hypothetical protein
MRTLNLLLMSTFALLAINQATQATQQSGTEVSVGEQLVRQLWVDFKVPNMNAIEKQMASGFQSVHQHGAHNRDQEIALIKEVNLGKYTLSDFKVTRTGLAVIVTYLASVEETIEGERLGSQPAARLDVFLETDSGWQWITHANLRPLK